MYFTGICVRRTWPFRCSDILIILHKFSIHVKFVLSIKCRLRRLGGRLALGPRAQNREAGPYLSQVVRHEPVDDSILLQAYDEVHHAGKAEHCVHWGESSGVHGAARETMPRTVLTFSRRSRGRCPHGPAGHTPAHAAGSPPGSWV